MVGRRRRRGCRLCLQRAFHRLVGLRHVGVRRRLGTALKALPRQTAGASLPPLWGRCSATICLLHLVASCAWPAARCVSVFIRLAIIPRLAAAGRISRPPQHCWQVHVLVQQRRPLWRCLQHRQGLVAGAATAVELADELSVSWGSTVSSWQTRCCEVRFTARTSVAQHELLGGSCSTGSVFRQSEKASCRNLVQACAWRCLPFGRSFKPHLLGQQEGAVGSEQSRARRRRPRQLQSSSWIAMDNDDAVNWCYLA